MELEFTVVLNNLEITLPLYGVVNVTVNWDTTNESLIDTYNTSGDKSYTYSIPGTYRVKITGTLTEFGNGANEYSNAERLTKIISFGNIGLTKLNGAFYNASNLISVPSQLPSIIISLNYTFYGASSFNHSNIITWNTSNVVDMSHMFYNASSFNQNIGSWNVSKVVDMSYMFYNASNFNQNIGNWMTNNVTNMSHMFDGASIFNQNISYKRVLGAWNVFKVTNMSYMFKNAKKFNQTISNWSVNNVTDMSYMFDNASSFNQIIRNWNVSKVTNMQYMFASASNFNQSIINWDTISVINMKGMFMNAVKYNISINYNQLSNSWNTSNVTDMSYMFSGATTFNQNISELITYNVTDMSYMFSNASKFNQYIALWNTSKVTNMSGMFMNASSFNQKIRYDSFNDYWNTHLVQDMSFMFSGASIFNKNIGSWDVSKVTNMESMFENATNFQKNISNWDISSLNNATDFLKNITLIQTFYDQLLISWSNQNIKSNVTFNGGNSIYSYGSPAVSRAFLTNTRNWTITDGGIEPFPDGNPMVLEYITTDYEQTITLPLNQTVDVVVYWGDENTDSYTTFGNKNHIYLIPSTYIVLIYGYLEQFGNVSTPYNNSDKLIKVTNWGDIGLKNLSGAFYGASNLIEVPSSLPSIITHLDYAFYNAINFNDQNITEWNVSNVTRMEFTFYGASSFNQNIGSWNVSNVTNMRSMFENAVSFNQDLSNWNISNVLDLTDFLKNVTLSIVNYDNIILSWSQLTLPSFIIFNAGNSYYSYGLVSRTRQSIIDTYNWEIIDGDNRPLTTAPLTLVFKVDIINDMITLPLNNSVNIDIDVDWGDGNLDSSYVIGNLNHTYLSSGTYTVKIYGILSQFGNGYTPYENSEKLISLVDFGDLGTELTSLSGAFNNATNLISVPLNLPSNITDLSYCFLKASEINDPNISNWDVSNVTDISFMFFYATSFNQSLTSWDLSNIINFKYILYGAFSYNQPLNEWLLDKINNIDN